MNFTQAITSGFRNYVTFSGRACRSEYWYWYLFYVVSYFVLIIIDSMVFPDNGMSPLSSIFSLATFLPSLAMGVRRLHDLDRTGWWWLIMLTGIGVILLIVWACMRGTAGPNRYGPDPLGSAAAGNIILPGAA